MIRYLLSKLLLIEAVLLLVPVAVAIYYRESSQVFTALFTTIGDSRITGWFRNFTKTKNQRIYAKEGILNCCPLLDSLVFLWGAPLCFYWANSQPYRCLF